MDKMNIAMNIQRLRKEQKLTQEQLAEKLGVSAQAVSKWENGITYPDITLIPELAELFEVSIEEIFGTEKQPPAVTYVEEAERKNLDEIFFRVRIREADGTKVNVNLPLALCKMMKNGASMIKIGNQEILEQLDMDVMIDLAERGILGRIVDIEDGDGTTVEVYIE